MVDTAAAARSGPMLHRAHRLPPAHAAQHDCQTPAAAHSAHTTEHIDDKARQHLQGRVEGILGQARLASTNPV